MYDAVEVYVWFFRIFLHGVEKHSFLPLQARLNLIIFVCRVPLPPPPLFSCLFASSQELQASTDDVVQHLEAKTSAAKCTLDKVR